MWSLLRRLILKLYSRINSINAFNELTVTWPNCHNEPFISKEMRSKKTNYKLLHLEFLYPHSLLLWLMSDCYLVDIINRLFICFFILFWTLSSVVFYYNYYLMLEIIFTLESNILFMLFSIFMSINWSMSH